MKQLETYIRICMEGSTVLSLLWVQLTLYGTLENLTDL